MISTSGLVLPPYPMKSFPPQSTTYLQVVDRIYNHEDSGFTYDTNPPGCTFLRYEMTHLSPSLHTYHLHGSPDNCRPDVPVFSRLPSYARVVVDDSGCGREVPIEQYWWGKGVKERDGGPLVVGGIEGVALEEEVRRLTIRFCYTPLHIDNFPP